MSLVIKVNGTDRSTSIEWDSVQWESAITKEVDRLEFRVNATAGRTIPDVADTIQFLEGSTKLFGGVVVERNAAYRSGILIGYTIKCKDYSHTLDRLLVIETYENMSPSDIVVDIIGTYASGFTTTNVQTTGSIIGSIKFNYQQVSRCLTDLCELIGWDWYVDADLDVHFFPQEANVAPFNLTDSSGNYVQGSLELNASILDLKNKIFVRGGEYKKEYTASTTPDVYLGDGTRTLFPLAYRYSAGVSVTKDAVAQTVGTDHLTDPTTVGALYNFEEKFVRFTVAPADGAVVKVFGDALVPILVSLSDDTSIASYGTYEAVVVDKSIVSVAEAQSRARAELDKYAANAYEATFRTTTSGLVVGQAITITSTNLGVTKTFRIVRISGRCKHPDAMEYSVYLLAAGKLTFTDIMVFLLQKDLKNLQISDNEVLQVLVEVTETMTLSDAAPTGSTSAAPYAWGPANGGDLLTEASENIITESGGFLLTTDQSGNGLLWNLGSWS